VAQSPENVLYATTWYLDVVAPTWVALVVIEDEVWQAVMPIPTRKKWGLTVVQQPLFCQFLGVFTHPLRDSNLLIGLLIKELMARFRYVSTYSFNPQNDLRAWADAHPDKWQTWHTHVLRLGTDYRSGYTTDRLQNWQRAQLFGWKIEASNDIVPLIELFRNHHASQIEGGVSEAAYALLQRLQATCRTHALPHLLYAKHHGHIEAGALFVVHGQRIVYLFNAASLTGRAGNARTAIIEHVLGMYAGQGFTFDFESPEVPSIAAHYRSYGATPAKYYRLRTNQTPFIIKQLQNIRYFFLSKT
jgi:hypothetical protein